VIRGLFLLALLDPRVEKLVAQVSEQRMVTLLKKLESFGTRSTLSSSIAPARQWIFDELKSYGKLEVAFDAYTLPKAGRITREVEARNVIAILRGKSARRIYVSGHYDTIAMEGRTVLADDAPAPGVDDDGSGTALTMELARVFAQSGIAFDATLVFMLHVAEEDGLLGAKMHAERALRDKTPIEAVLNNDIVGGERGGNGIADGASVRVYSEGPEDSPSRALARFVRRWGMRYVPGHEVRLMARADRFQRAGDHSAYAAAGFAAVGFRESRENLQRQHNARDTFETISPAYLTRNARINAACAATLALAPPPPLLGTIDRLPSGYDAHLRWSASPGATSYRIFWREAWGPDWQHEREVGDVTEVTLPDTLIDDLVFGVAAVDAQGHESPISAYVASPFRF
jgi:hypothetical protein